MAVFYDPNGGCLRSALHISNTSVQSVTRRAEFWFLLFLHVGLWVAFRLGYLRDLTHDVWHVSFHDLNIIGSLTTFFEVFFTNQCYSRYLHLYDKTRLMLGNLYDYCFELRLYLSPCQEYARLASRQIIASTLLFFEELDSVTGDSVWEGVKKPGLVKAQEQEFLAKFALHQRSTIMLQWSAEAARAGHIKAKAPPNTFKALLDKLLICRALQQEVLDTTSLPVPFQYFHLLKSMIIVTSVIWAWRMATSPSIFAPVLFFFLLITLMGMMEVASEMSDPFGDDAIDFPVVEWMDEFIEDTAAFMDFQNPPDLLTKWLDIERPMRQLEPRDLKFLIESPPSREGSHQLLEDDSARQPKGYRALQEW